MASGGVFTAEASRSFSIHIAMVGSLANMPSAGHSYIISAKRTALGRVGGLHRSRRIEALAAPVVAAVLDDSGLEAGAVDEVILGNTMQGGNPARLIGLAAGLPETASAITIDRQCASGLDAIVAGCRSIESGEAEVVIAGGAESISTAPWRIAKPKSLYQTPHFIGLEAATEETGEDAQLFEASEVLSQRLNISRDQQDQWALRSHLKANAAQDKRTFLGEIVPLRGNAEEARDQSAGVDPSLDELTALPPFLPPTGTLTPGNTSSMHDGAAIVAIVSEAVWQKLGKPPALRFVAGVSQGVVHGNEAGAPMEAMKKLYGRLEGFNTKDIGLVELNENSAAQAIAFSSSLGLEDDLVNPDGGAIVRGNPLAAAGAVLVVRLFTRMVRQRDDTKKANFGIATLGAIGGIGVAAMFEAI